MRLHDSSPWRPRHGSRPRATRPLLEAQVLAGTMHPLACASWTGLVSYIFVGIEEVGVQVEQPFEIVPMTQLCNVIMMNLAEAFEELPELA